MHTNTHNKTHKQREAEVRRRAAAAARATHRRSKRYVCQYGFILASMGADCAGGATEGRPPCRPRSRRLLCLTET